MRTVLVYTYPQGGANGHYDKAIKFIHTYHAHPPAAEHDTVIVCNEKPANEETKFLFSSIPNVSFLDRDGSGWDIGGFQHAAQVVPCDLMVFFGGHTYFRRSGWLTRMIWAYQKYGDTLYGATGNQGDLPRGVYPHIRTTAFWCNPRLMNAYPHRVIQGGMHGQRYEFEHGATGLTTWMLRQARQCWVVSWDSVFGVRECNMIPEGYHQGYQSNVLVGDRMTSPPFWPYE